MKDLSSRFLLMNRCAILFLLLSFFSAQSQDHQFKLVPLEFTPTFSPDSKLLFFDVPNYVSITANEGMTITDTLVSGASIVSRKGQLGIRPFEEEEVEIRLTAIDETSGRTAEFVRKYQIIQPPRVTINDVKADSIMPSVECLFAGKLDPRIEGYYLPMKVVSFRMETVHKGEYIDLGTTGGGLSKEMRQVIYDVNRSIEVLFYDVWISYGTGVPIRAQNYRVYITEDKPNPTSLGIGVIKR